MEKIITARSASQEELELEMPEYLRQFPLPLQKQAEEALWAFQSEDFQRAAQLCDELLLQTDVPDIRVMRGQCYFFEQDRERALEIFENLAAEYPENEHYRILNGMAYHASGDYQQAVATLGKLYPPEKYYPFYYTSYGDSLMRLGKWEQAKEVFDQEVKHFELTGEIPSASMIDGAFQNIFRLDLETGNGCFQADMESYWKFLDAATMDSQMQNHLADTVFLLSNFLTIQDFRPLFKQFIEHVREAHYITEQPFLSTLESGFSAMELQRIHDDRKIGAMLETFLVFSIDARKAEQQGTIADNPEIKARLAVYEWYVCHYAPDYPEELEYIRETFPYTYRAIEGFLAEIKEDVRQAAEKRLKFLEPYYQGKSIADIRVSMEEAYRRALQDQKEPSFVYDGMETYKRIQPKVGRNDPCPCGSGKKYKKCCGR